MPITVLFQGDSITDAGRNLEDAESLGVGYAMMIGSWFNAKYPAKQVRFLNRGISGHRVADLQARWQRDCLDLKPDWLSIMIGINDTWRRYDSNDPTSAEKFESGYRDILTRTKKQLNPRLILCEPFILHVSQEKIGYREDLDPKIEIVRQLAKEFNAILIPLDKIFTDISALRNPVFWASDGIHPSPAGHALIAQSWLDTVGHLLG